eukprot:16248-Heterococcus_DN1.PRE.6
MVLEVAPMRSEVITTLAALNAVVLMYTLVSRGDIAVLRSDSKLRTDAQTLPSVVLGVPSA